MLSHAFYKWTILRILQMQQGILSLSKISDKVFQVKYVTDFVVFLKKKTLYHNAVIATVQDKCFVVLCSKPFGKVHLFPLRLPFFSQQ